MAVHRPITGRHVTVWLVVFFGIVFAVNMAMATLAITSFGGTVVDNSYVASQHYNDWLAAGRAQRALGWQVSAVQRSDGAVIVRALDAQGAPISDAELRGIARHPLGGAREQALQFVAIAPGEFVARSMLPTGRWQLYLTVGRGTQTARYRVDLS